MSANPVTLAQRIEKGTFEEVLGTINDGVPYTTWYGRDVIVTKEFGSQTYPIAKLVRLFSYGRDGRPEQQDIKSQLVDRVTRIVDELYIQRSATGYIILFVNTFVRFFESGCIYMEMSHKWILEHYEGSR